MKRIIKHMEEAYLQRSLEMVERVFTEYDCAAEGKMVRALVEEIRGMPSVLSGPRLRAITGYDVKLQKVR